MRCLILRYWKLSGLSLALLLLGSACGKEKLENRLESQQESFYKIWHPLDHVPTASMSPATLAYFRKTWLARSKMSMRYESSVHNGSWNSMLYQFQANQENYDLKFSINNGRTLQLTNPDGPWLGFTHAGLPSGQNAHICFILDDREVGTYFGRIPKRLEMEPTYGKMPPNAPRESNTQLWYRWEPDLFYKPRQLLMELHFQYANGSGLPLQFYLIPDNGFFNITSILDTTSVDRLKVTFRRFEGDLIDPQMGFLFEFESIFEHQIDLR